MSQTYLGVRDARYQGLMEVYKKAYPDKAFLTMQADVKKIWKEELDKGKDEKLFNDKMVELNAKIKRGSLLTFFKSASKPKPKETPKPKVQLDCLIVCLLMLWPVSNPMQSPCNLIIYRKIMSSIMRISP